MKWLWVLLWMALIFVLSAQPKLPDVPVLDTLLCEWSWEDWSDKLKHFVAYAVLAGLVWHALGSGASRRRRLWLAIGISAVYGATDEFHQRFVANRSCDLCDWTVDALAAALAALIAYRVTQHREPVEGTAEGGVRWQGNGKKPTKTKPTKSKTRGE